ncbi:RNA ligase family protein [Hahella sp. CR1]|uniref:RNA ligase family protein n=1 Tax=Hahella sp. CR1 TaxID=2992807 RepID=UPI00244141F8|nr:RNA ligase family protein [Hahella sp. CR1]MDG9666539.1 RNA ligase family protein [Hahella sp. CR1]
MFIRKYPRTPHLQGSRLQPGDSASDQVPYSQLAGRYLVIEEKLDGANAGVSFDASGALRLQSRGHVLTGGGRESQFAQFKSWATVHQEHLFEILGTRYTLYGEWMASKHTVFYDRLPHLFAEFDILDTETGEFLSTSARRRMLKGSPVLSVPVLYAGLAPRRLAELQKLVRPSLAKTTQWRNSLEQVAHQEALDFDLVKRQTDDSDLSEGLYIKIEENGHTVGRLKWVRHDFIQAILDSGSHHLNRPIFPNQLAQGVDMYAPQLTLKWEDLGHSEPDSQEPGATGEICS